MTLVQCCNCLAGWPGVCHSGLLDTNPTLQLTARLSSGARPRACDSGPPPAPAVTSCTRTAEHRPTGPRSPGLRFDGGIVTSLQIYPSAA